MKTLVSSHRPSRISKLHGGGDMAKRKKSPLKLGKVTYGDQDPQQVFTAAFAPYFAGDSKEGVKKAVNG